VDGCAGDGWVNEKYGLALASAEYVIAVRAENHDNAMPRLIGPFHAERIRAHDSGQRLQDSY